MTGNNVLTQAEIDAMLSGGSAADESPVEPPPPVPAVQLPATPAPPVEEAPPAAPAPMPVPVSPSLPVDPDAPGDKPRWPEDPAAIFDALVATVTGMAHRLGNAEQTLEQFDRLQMDASESRIAVADMKQGFEDLEQQIKSLTGQMQNTLEGLKGTFGYRAKQTFTCDSCRASGKVATRIKCTHCGKENWWGWWPPK